jgi:GTP-binding protein
VAAGSQLQLEFVTSGTRVDQLPDSPAEIAIVGRSNVGKSSLINALANRNQLARVSKTPGRTQLLNLFRLPDGTSVVDLPGYGYAKVPAAVRKQWAPMIEGYLLGREELRLVVLLLDAEVGPTALDLQTLEWLLSHDVAVELVATKHDKVRPSQRERRKRDLAAKCGREPGDVLWVSASKGVNITLLRDRIRGWLSLED